MSSGLAMPLRPCPFCGSDSLNFGCTQTWCNSCGVKFVPLDTYRNREEAIKAWDTRAHIQGLCPGEAAPATMGYLLEIIGDGAVESRGMMTWEQGLRRIRKFCEIVLKPNTEGQKS